MLNLANVSRWVGGLVWLAALCVSSVHAQPDEQRGDGDHIPVGLRRALAATHPDPGYEVVLEPGGRPDVPRWTADNPAHGLRTRFTPLGVRVGERGQPSAPSLITMQLIGWGRAGALQVPEPAEVAAEGATIEYRRGALVEWYVNTPGGLEQGFTIESPPGGNPDAPLEVRLAWGGSLAPRLDANALGLGLADGRGVNRWSYSGLAAWDAAGRPLDATLLLEGGVVLVRVHAADADYPITIDPVITNEQDKLTAPDTTGQFGWSVAISGDTALVGAVSDSHSGEDFAGSAYVFVRSGGRWSQQAKLTASDASTFDAFGESVAISGDTALVGALRGDGAAGDDVGAAYVFVRSGDLWSEQAKLTASDGALFDFFGWSVAVSGDTALVGSYHDDNAGGERAGAAYVFVRSGGTWSEQAKLTAPDATPGAQFGQSVAVSGDTSVIGSGGGAYVFVLSGGRWSEQARLTPSGLPASFGRSVALSGETALVGAPGAVPGGGLAAGSAHAFVRSGGRWSEQAVLTTSDTESGPWFGHAVALSGDMAVVGAVFPLLGDDDTAHAFVRSGNHWSELTKLQASDAAGFLYFGGSVALSGETALVGAHNANAVYVFALQDDPGPGGTLTGVVRDAESGAPLAGATITVPTAPPAISGPDGVYTVTGVAAGLASVTAAASGFYDQLKAAQVVADNTSVLDFALVPTISEFGVVSVTGLHTGPAQHAYYVDTVPCEETLVATVDWDGETPGSVRWTTPFATYEDPWPQGAVSVSRSFDMGTDFEVGGELKVVAITGGSSPEISPAYTGRFDVVPVPPPIPEGVLYKVQGNALKYASILFPSVSAVSEGAPVPADFPFLGGKDVTLGFAIGFTAEVSGDGTGEAVLKVGGEVGLPPLNGVTKLAGATITPNVTGKVLWEFDKEPRDWVTTGSLQVGADVKLPVLPPVLVPLPLPFPVSAKGCIEVGVLLGGAIAGWERDGSPILSMVADLDPMAKGSLTVAAGAVDMLAVQATGGLGVSLAAQWPQEPTLEKLALALSALIEFKALIFSYPVAYWEAAYDLLDPMDVAAGVGRRSRWWVQGPRIQSRDYLDGGAHARFVGDRPPSGGSSSSTAQTEIELNVYPQSEPVLAAAGGPVLLAWLKDDPARSPVNRTEATVSVHDAPSAGAWSPPLAIADDGTADFEPDVIGVGTVPGQRFLAAWTNVSEVLAEPDDPDDPVQVAAKYEELKSKSEIAVAFYDSAGASWGPQQILTSNLSLDRSPRVASAADGSALVTWVRNARNDITGKPAAPNELWAAAHDGAAWQPAGLIASGVPSVLQSDLAYRTGRAVLVFSGDTDGDPLTTSDHELFATERVGGVWGPIWQLTDDAVADDGPQVVFDAAGELVLAWYRDADVVSTADLALSTVDIVVAGQDSALGSSDFRLAADAVGSVGIVWSDPSDDLADLWYTLRDPTGLAWGLPQRLTTDESLEYGTAAAFDDGGDLVIAYDRAAITYQAETVVVGTDTMELEVPVTGQVDLVTLRHVPGVDLGIAAEDVTVEPPNPAPGVSASLNATVRNQGAYPVSDVTVEFRDNGSLIGSTIVPGPILAGDSAQATLPWDVPDPGMPHVIDVTLDPSLLFDDLDLGNNSAQLTDVALPDLALDSIQVQRFGAFNHAFIVRVTSEGALDVPAGSVVSLHAQSAMGDVLTSWTIPEAITPGAFRDLGWQWVIEPGVGIPTDMKVVAVVEPPFGTVEFDDVNNERTAKVWQYPEKPYGK